MAKEEINAFLGTGTSYKGNLSFQGTVRVDGAFDGEVDSEGTLVVGREARLSGIFRVGQLILSGTLEGDVQAVTRVILHKEANLQGTIRSPSLMIEEGAVVEGSVSMGTLSSEKAGNSPEE